MLKKSVSMFIAVAMVITAMVSVTAFAATTGFKKVDLSTYSVGDAYAISGNNSSIVVEEDGRKAVLIGKKGDAYVNGDTNVTLHDTLSANNPNGLPAGTKGIVINTTFKLSSTAPQILLTPSSSVPRYIDITGGKIKYCNATSNQTDTGWTVSAGIWYDLKYMLNYETGYIKITLTNLSTSETKTHTATQADFIRTAEQLATITDIKWWHTGNQSGNMYIAKYEVYAENDSDAIAASKTVVRDNFDSATSTVSSPWTTTTTQVTKTDRGNSAILGINQQQYLSIVKTSQILPSTAKGLVSEFSVKFTGAAKTGFFYSLGAGRTDYATPNRNLIRFANNGNINVNGTTNIWGTWVKNIWYDIRIEYNFVDKVIRYTIDNGSTEKTASYNYTHDYFDSLADEVRLDFVSENVTTDQNILIDDINVYWIDALTASGITSSNDAVSVDNAFENFAVGTEAINADMICGKPTSFWKTEAGGTATYAIEEVLNSGRGKSFKATVELEAGNNQSFYKDFAAIQNGIVSFDIMFATEKGLTLISAQASEADNSDTSNTQIFRFDNWGNIKDGSNKNVLGRYNAGEWYKVVLIAGVYSDVSGVKYQVYGRTGLVAEGITETNSGGICRDSIRYARINMHDYDNTLYVDNYKAYAPSATKYGIYPVAQMAVKGSNLTPENKIKLRFSKFVDLTKSSFTVNGEIVDASGTDIITLDNEIETGKTYTVEYTVYDLDGYRAYGYVPGIKGEDVYKVSQYTKATLANPAATATVSVGAAAGAKDIVLYVATYSGSELLSVATIKKTVDSDGEEFTVAIDADGADSIKTFLWNADNLTPIQ